MEKIKQYRLSLGAAFVAVSLLGCPGEPDPRMIDIDARLTRLERVPMNFDARGLSQQTNEMLKALTEAGQLLHEAYLYQYAPEGIAIRDSLGRQDGDLSNKLLRLVERNGGPYDKMDDFTNFVYNNPKPPGSGFYPADLTKEEFEGYLARYMHRSKDLMSPYTVVRRDNGGLKAIPFHEEYARYVVPAAELLKKASTLTDNVSFKKFLELRAEALLTDDYTESHVAWLEVVDSDIDLLMAPDEVYDDGLMGLKASYEVSVMLKDSAATAKVDFFGSYLNELEMNLPIDEKYKRPSATLKSPMYVVNDIFRGGDIATGYQAVATTLPNDPIVRNTKGTKIIFWKNMMVARVEKIILPIAYELISSDQVGFVTTQGVFSNTIMHELCHSVGPIYVHSTGETISVNEALKEHYTTIEEAKADAAGLHSMRYFIRKGVLGKEMEQIHAVSALASIFRTIRFSTTEAHAKASLCALNYLRNANAIRYDQNTKRWSVIFDRFESAVADLAGELLLLEATGDFEGTEKFLNRWSVMPVDVEQSLRRLDHVPVDIEPVYDVKWK